MTCPSRSSVEATIIATVGILLHWEHIHLITDIDLSPSIPSLIWTFSILAILLYWRPKRDQHIDQILHLLIFLVEAAIIFCANEIIWRYVWITCLVHIWTISDMQLLSFSRADSFYFLRFLLALLSFIAMCCTYSLDPKTWQYFETSMNEKPAANCEPPEDQRLTDHPPSPEHPTSPERPPLPEHQPLPRSPHFQTRRNRQNTPRRTIYPLLGRPVNRSRQNRVRPRGGRPQNFRESI